MVEMLIVVCIIGILAAIAVPKFASLIRRSHEATTKGNLSALRHAIAMYYTHNEGRYPTDNLGSLVSGGYINKIPYVWTSHHPKGDSVGAGSEAQWAADPNKWYYFNLSTDQKYGQIVVNCSHPDLNGRPWDEN